MHLMVLCFEVTGLGKDHEVADCKKPFTVDFPFPELGDRKSLAGSQCRSEPATPPGLLR